MRGPTFADREGFGLALERANDQRAALAPGEATGRATVGS
jgi:hypothetical protein